MSDDEKKFINRTGPLCESYEEDLLNSLKIGECRNQPNGNPAPIPVPENLKTKNSCWMSLEYQFVRLVLIF
jgi:hypothetical protein